METLGEAGVYRTEEGEKRWAEKSEEEKKAFKCRFCGLSYNYMTTLKAHERVHNVEEPYVCAKCDMSFRFYSEYDYHTKSHKGQKGYKCKCDRSFFNYSDLIHHTCREVDGVGAEELRQPMQGEGVSPLLMEAFTPIRPLAVTSERFKPYICQYCSKSYSNGNDLKYHMYSHRGERAFNVRSSRSVMAKEPEIDRLYSYADFG